MNGLIASFRRERDTLIARQAQIHQRREQREAARNRLEQIEAEQHVNVVFHRFGADGLECDDPRVLSVPDLEYLAEAALAEAIQNDIGSQDQVLASVRLVSPGEPFSRFSTPPPAQSASEESLIADQRASLSPAQMVEQKLVALLKGNVVFGVRGALLHAFGNKRDALVL